MSLGPQTKWGPIYFTHDIIPGGMVRAEKLHQPRLTNCAFLLVRPLKPRPVDPQIRWQNAVPFSKIGGLEGTRVDGFTGNE
jgi:hypothetical protein